MESKSSATKENLLHVVTLECKDHDQAIRCMEALANYGRPDALAFNCRSYEFGLKEGSMDTVCLVERWCKWEDLDNFLTTKVAPALPMYNQLLKRPFDPARDTLRITLHSQ